VIFAPGGGFAAKCWPEPAFAALLDQLAPHRAILIGGAHDRPMTGRLAANRPHVEDRAGQCSLRETFALIAGAKAVVCNSSMAMHAAAAFRKPCLVLLGEHFADADQHAAQWGYPETHVLGRSREHPAVWAPAEVWPILRSLLPTDRS
jgi:heptosyltransferase-2